MDINDIISNFPHRLGEAILNIWGSRNSRRTDNLEAAVSLLQKEIATRRLASLDIGFLATGTISANSITDETFTLRGSSISLTEAAFRSALLRSRNKMITLFLYSGDVVHGTVSDTGTTCLYLRNPESTVLIRNIAQFRDATGTVWSAPVVDIQTYPQLLDILRPGDTVSFTAHASNYEAEILKPGHDTGKILPTPADNVDRRIVMRCDSLSDDLMLRRSDGIIPTAFRFSSMSVANRPGMLSPRALYKWDSR